MLSSVTALFPDTRLFYLCFHANFEYLKKKFHYFKSTVQAKKLIQKKCSIKQTLEKNESMGNMKNF